jgi:hypothetical protein
VAVAVAVAEVAAELAAWELAAWEVEEATEEAEARPHTHGTDA